MLASKPIGFAEDAVAAQRPQLLSLERIFPVLSITLLLFAFLPVFPGGDAMAPGSSGRVVLEITALVAAGMISFVYAYLRGMFRRLATDPIFLCMTGLSCWAMISSLWAVNTLLALSKGFELLLITFTIAVLSASVPTERKYRITASVFLAFVFVLLVFNLGYWHTLAPFSEITDVPTVGTEPLRPRLFLGFAYPLFTADILSFSSIFVLYISRWPRIVRMLLFLGLVTLNWFTDGRIPLFGLFLGLFLNLCLAIRRPLQRRLLFVGLAVLILAINLYLQGDGLNVLIHLLPKDFSTLNGRTELWSFVLGSLIPSHLMLGVGFYSTRFFLLPHFFWAGHAHNSFLELLLGLGAVGAVFGVVFVWLWLRIAFRPWNRVALAASVYTLVHGFSNPLLFLPNMEMVALLLALPARLAFKAVTESSTAQLDFCGVTPVLKSNLIVPTMAVRRGNERKTVHRVADSEDSRTG